MIAHSAEGQTASGQDIAKLAELIKGIHMAMLTTIEADGSLRSRPMATQTTLFDGTLWFFTGKDSGKVREVDGDHAVNVAYADVQRKTFVSVTGTARLVDDRAKAKELWSPVYKIWFPKGLEDPNLALLRVDVREAEYWESPHNAAVRLLGFLKGLATGDPSLGGEHRHVQVT